MHRTRLNASIGLTLLTVGGVLVKRSPAIGTAIVICGMLTMYLAIAGRGGKS
jgi:hypothetical protein